MDFDEINGVIVKDKSAGGNDGVYVDNPSRVFSGAPIGDVSVYQYSNVWTGKTVQLNNNGVSFQVQNILGIPRGVHIYQVLSSPSQTTGLGPTVASSPYHGVFIADLDYNNTFGIASDSQGIEPCNIFLRDDNSLSTWMQLDISTENHPWRGEFIISGDKSNISLGDDILSCDEEFIVLSPQSPKSGSAFFWSTGEKTQTIQVTKSGNFWVKITDDCGISSDTIAVSLAKPPTPFSFGENQSICKVSGELKPYQQQVDYQFAWQDGSTNDSFAIDNFGTYWVTVSNECGEVHDTITYTLNLKELDLPPNVITPNQDNHNDVFKINEAEENDISFLVINRWGKEVYFSNSYKNDWGGGDLSSGVYYYIISGRCIEESRGSITILH